MKKIFLILILLLSFIQLKAEEIHLINKDIYKNVKIIFEVNFNLQFKFNDSTIAIPNHDIENIIRSKYQPNVPSEFITTQKKRAADIKNDPCNDKIFSMLQQKDSLTTEELKAYVELKKLCEQSRMNGNNSSIQNKTIVKEYKRLPLLLVGGLSFFGCYHFLKKADEKSDAIEAAQLFHLNTSDLESEKNTAFIAGIGFGIFGLITSIFALTPVEVEVTPTQLSFRYNF